MDFARADERVVAPADAAFSDILAFPPGSHPGVVVLRVPADWNSEQRSTTSGSSSRATNGTP